MKILLFFSAAIASFYAVQGLFCWTCEREPTNDLCLSRGKMVACLPNQQNCQNEVRRTQTNDIEVSKRCKQDLACNNNFIQNAKARQCTFVSKVPDSTCRCCCRSNLCNIPEIGCHEDPPEPPPVCDLINAPIFGTIECTPIINVDRRARKAAIGVECNFACRDGYLLYGADKSICTMSQFSNTARFNRPKPRCRAMFCDPPRTAPANGDVLCTDGNNIRSVCTYTCQVGFALIGRMSTRCGLNNRWSERPPTCRSIVCLPAHENPRRGRVECTDENRLFSVCSFTCDQGFLLEGSDTSMCEDDGSGDFIGRWTQLPPICQRIRCNPPHRNPSNGMVSCTDTNEEGSVCSFTCNNGFFLAGSPSSTCEDDGDMDDDGLWSTDAPTCTVIVCNPPQVDPTNGVVLCSNQNFFNSNCRFTCNSGFFLNGVRDVLCVDDEDDDNEGLWNNSPPTCSRITCNPPQSNPENGDVSCNNGNNLFSVCSFACQDGFAVVGPPSVRCNDDNDRDDDGVWSRDPPICSPVTCTAHVDPVNGRVDCTDSNNYASVCSFRCNDGFSLDGSPRSVCGDDEDGDTEGVWSTPAPTCARIRCLPRHRDPSNGEVMCTDSNNEGSVCTFSCNGGYFLNGPRRSTCNDDNDGDNQGVWDNDAPTCVAITCEPPRRNPTNGNVQCSNRNNLDSRCEFGCNRGFFLNGDLASVCEDDGNGDELGLWSTDAPVCEQITCEPPHRDPVNGDVTCTNRNNEGSVCRFTCNTGFFLDGSAASRCVDDGDGDALGEWNQPAPTCPPITCEPAHRDPANGNVDCTNTNFFMSACTFTCLDGYFLSGQRRSVCQDDNDNDADGVWSTDPPRCIRITCRPAFANPDNGRVDCSDSNNRDSVCTFTCNAGYFRNGERTSTCLDDNDNDADGVWSNQAPTCELISCQPEHVDPFNGDVDCTNGNTLNSRCTFDCDIGFFLNGDEVSVCEDDGNGDALGAWSTDPPICEGVTCVPPHTDPVNGDVSCTNQNNANSVCTFTCDSGYFLDGSATSTCRDDDNGDEFGLWTTDAPLCRPITCSPPFEDPSNGDVTCSNGNFFLSVCTFECNDGYFLEGAPRSTCEDDNDRDAEGEWSSLSPDCVRITCSPGHVDPTDGSVSCTDSNNRDSVCTFSCDGGFYLIGSEQSTCRDDNDNDAEGEWDQDAPTCGRITCNPAHIDPNNGGVTCTRNNFVGSTCTFECNDGFFLNGQPQSTCRDDGNGDSEGDWTTDAPTCVSILCRPPHVDPTNGGVVCTDGNNEDSVCTFTCNDGYFLSGDMASTCVDDRNGDEEGVWSTDPPVCLRVFCLPPHENPENGGFECTDFNNEGSVCSFTCNSGYFLDGSSTSTCVDDNDNDQEGEWDEDAPTCVLIRCPPPHVNPANGLVECSNTNFYLSVCTFTCDPNFFLDGSMRSTCEDDNDNDAEGMWDNEAPICQQITCEPPHTNPGNGIVGCTDTNNLNSRCTFECDLSYFLNGMEVSTCVDDNDDDAEGVWSSEAPICELITCEPPQQSPANGNVRCTNGNILDSECTFSCVAGFFLNGNEVLTCDDDNGRDAMGEWSSEAPICSTIFCPPPHVAPANGDVDCTDGNLENSVCTFTCNAGFSLIGSETSTCADDNDGDPEGLWSTDAPSCVDVSCSPEYNDLTNGMVGCTNRNFLGSVCTFDCDNGFFLRGNMQSTCRDDNDDDAEGVWSSIPPTCIRVTCIPPHVDPANGEVVCTDSNNAGSTCTFMCDAGFARVGRQTSLCVDDGNGDAVGVWTEDPPTCEQITCQPPYTEIANGQVECTDANLLGSLCEFVCNSNDFALNGEGEAICVEMDEGGGVLGVWTTPPPTCDRKTCGEAPGAPSNGFRACPNGFFLDSQCTYDCIDFHTLVGVMVITCIEQMDGSLVWDNEAPTCEPIVCEEQFINNGRVECTDNTFIASTTCNFICNDGFSVFPEMFAQNECRIDRNWSSPPPCCARLCPPFANIDLVIIMDASTSIDEFNWDSMRYFVRNITDAFTLDEDDGTQIGVFRYNRDVDTRTQILLNRFRTPDRKDRLLQAIGSLPYNPLQNGTVTGTALRHARDALFNRNNGDRENVQNVVLLLTDGQSQDSVVEISNQLQADGVLTFAIGIFPPFGNLDNRELIQITGSEDRVIIAFDGFEALDEQFAALIAEQLCPIPECN